MTGPRVFGRRLIASLRAARAAGELRDEIASHLAEATEEYVRRGCHRGKRGWRRSAASVA
jgi:hypothetical protein